MKIKKRKFCIILILSIVIHSSLAFADADKIFKENSNAVVVIETFDKEGKPISQGSGFIVREDGAIVTNYHVISNAEDIKVKAGDKVLKIEGLLHIDKENDVVILKAKGEKLQILKIGDIEKLRIGEKVYVISSPEGLENTISDGILSGIRKIEPQRKILQITAPISAGSSGGPVFNKNGKVVGIATFLLKEAQNINFAMPVNLIKDKISARKVIALKDAEIVDYEKTAEYWFNLGYYHIEAGLYKEAIYAFTQSIKIKPDYELSYLGLGIAYNQIGMYKEAIEAYKQAIRIKPDFVGAYAYFGIGSVYIRLRMFEEAIEELKQAIRIKPNYEEAYAILGAAYDYLEKYKDSIEAYKQAIKVKPDFAEAYSSLGFAYTNLGMYKEAIEACKKAVNINPDILEGYACLGRAYAKLDMYKESMAACKQAVRINPDDAQTYDCLALTYIGLGMFKEAMEASEQLLRISPDDARAHSNLGIVYLALKKYKEAIESFKQAIKIKPYDPYSHFLLGATYLMVKDKDSAMEEYQILKKLDPQWANGLFNLMNRF